MPCELSARRAEFSPGIAVPLADGRTWTLPGPISPGCEGAEYEDLVAATCQAEDEPERRRAELALAIFLLGCNYELGPDDYRAILECPPGDSALVEMQQAFRDAAAAHAKLLVRPRPGVSPAKSPMARA